MIASALRRHKIISDGKIIAITSAPLLDWLGDTGATKVAIHFDVDTIDADEIQLGQGADLGGLTSAQARRVVADIDGAAEVLSPSPSPSSYLVR